MTRYRWSRPADRLWPAVLGGWALAAAALLCASARDIARFAFPDPDDAMRLIEVRDWLGGQSWWDVGQHRLNGGDFPMHWSRLVDLPIAFFLRLFDPLLGSEASTRVAMIVVPLLTLLCVMALGAVLTRTLAGAERARFAILLAPLSVPIVAQMRPMRIDHHGWQVVLAMAAVASLVGGTGRRSGAAAGLALAALLTVSMEGMPIAAAILGVAMLGWAVAPERRAQAGALLAIFVPALALLHAGTRGPGMFLPACDAIAPAWIAALAVAAAGCALTIAAVPRQLAVRLGALTASGAMGVGALVLLAPACLKGPFATLDPLVYSVWYHNVSEGLPIWDQQPAWIAMTIGFPLAGLIGAALAIRATFGEQRLCWIGMTLVALAGLALSLLVQRAGATANALALPGGAWLLHALLTRARRVRSVLARTVATAGALLAATPGLAAAAMLTPVRIGHQATSAEPGARTCVDGTEIADLSRLAPATIFAPLDVSPALLARTHHRAVGSGYHRSAIAIHRVLATFMASPVSAKRSVRASGALYVAGCPGLNETDLYAHLAPQGLWARLQRGERVDWLEPVPLGNSPVLVWRVKTPHPRLPEPPVAR